MNETLKDLKVGFKGKSEKDVEQQKKEFNWILHKMGEAKTPEQKEKWDTKFENWLEAHPFTKKSMDEIAKKIADDCPVDAVAQALADGEITKEEAIELLKKMRD